MVREGQGLFFTSEKGQGAFLTSKKGQGAILSLKKGRAIFYFLKKGRARRPPKNVKREHYFEYNIGQGWEWLETYFQLSHTFVSYCINF